MIFSFISIYPISCIRNHTEAGRVGEYDNGSWVNDQWITLKILAMTLTK